MIGPAPVADDPVQPFQQPEEWRRDDGEDAVVDGEVETLGERGEDRLVLRPDVERNVDAAGRARWNRADRHDDAGRVNAVVELARVELAMELVRVGGQPGGDEIMLDHADPAVVRLLGVGHLACRIGGLLVELGEFDLLVLVRLVVDHRARVRRRRHRVVRALRLGVAQQLEICVGRDRRRPCVRDLVADVDHVAATMEGQRLDHLVAVRRSRLQLHLELVGARRERRAGPAAPRTGPVIRHAVADHPDWATKRRSGVRWSAR